MANTLKIKRGTAATIPQGQLAEPLFTTDTYDLYIGKGSGGNQRFQKYIASGTSSQFLKGDGSLDSTTYQTALTFSSPLVNTSGTISIPVATGSVNGYLSSTDWTTFNSKEPAITAGTNLQYYRGDKTFQTLDTSAVPENGAVYFTEPRVRSTVLTGLNLSGGGTIAATDSVLTAFGKLQNQISAVGTGVTYQGTWNASTNSPTITSGTGTKGYYYVVSVAGSTNIDGITDWNIGDWIIFNGTAWDQVDNTDAVSSVNGFTGAVNLALDNISDVSAATPTNAQLLRFNGTSSLWENWTPTFEPALTKGNLTEATSSVLTITGGSNAVIGSGTTIEVKQASSTVNGYLSSTDWTTFNNKQATITLTTTGTSGAATFSSNTLNIPQYQAALTNPVTGTGTSQYLAKFTSTGSAIGDSSMYYSEGANFNDYTFGSIGSGNKYNNSNFNIYSNSNASLYLQFGSNKYAQLYNLYGDVGISVANSGVHGTFNILYFNGTGTRYVTLNTASGEALRINENKTIRFTEYSSNGFVKTSSNNGTLTVDTTSYLPLTGGTLTGALSGTSATFSGNVLVGGTTTYNPTFAQRFLILEAGTTGDNTAMLEIVGSRTVTGTYGALEFLHKSGANRLAIRAKRGSADNSVGMDILVTNAGTTSTALDISSTGAATFSSSVTADGLIRTNFGIVQLFEASTFRGGVYTYKNWIGSGTDYSMVFGSNGELNLIAGGGTTKQFTLATTGAATFSSSVTAGGVISNTVGDTNQAMRLNAATGFLQFTPYYDTTYGAFINSLNAAASAYLPITIQGSKIMFLQGNVGIGTSSPNRLLDVNGVIRTQNAGSAGAPSIELGTSAQGNGLFYPTTNTIAIATNDNERMRITSGGELLINTTTDSGAYYLQVNGSVYATAYYESSDIRLKNILSTKASDNFSAIEFNWKDGRDDKKHWGYAAQDVLKFIPDAIEINNDGMMTVNYNEAHTWKIAMLEERIKFLESKLN